MAPFTWIAAIVLTFILVLVLLLTWRIPPVIPIERRMVMQASSDAIFPYLNRPELALQWNPFLSGDPKTVVHFSGPKEGEGATWNWKGPKAGMGKATLTRSESLRRVAMRLEFEKPFRAANQSEYRLVPQGEATEVHWVVYETARIPRVINRLISLDRLVGSQFEKGLASLKQIVESQ